MAKGKKDAFYYRDVQKGLFGAILQSSLNHLALGEVEKAEKTLAEAKRLLPRFSGQRRDELTRVASDFENQLTAVRKRTQTSYHK